MTQQKNLSHILLASTLAAFAAGAFLLPAGASIPHLMYWAALFLLAGSLAAFAYARGKSEVVAPIDQSLQPQVEWYTTQGRFVPASLLAGSAPLIGLIAEGQVANPELVAKLAPYFAEPTLAFVQGAARYDGVGGVADAFRLSAALGSEIAQGRSAVNAVELTNTGAILSREALRDAWQPGLTWAALGMRLQALGYTGRFEQQPMTLAWAPQTVSEYAAYQVAHTTAALHTTASALATKNLPLEIRLQYLANAAAPLAAWAVAITGALSAFSLVVFNTGPVIMTSPAALMGDVLTVLCSILTLAALYLMTGINPARPAALAVAGAYTTTGELAYRAATSTYAKRTWSMVADAARATAATARAGGSADTAPAGTPARS